LAQMLTYLDQSTTTHLDGAKLAPSNTVCIAAAAMALVPQRDSQRAAVLSIGRGPFRGGCCCHGVATRFGYGWRNRNTSSHHWIPARRS